MSLKAFTLPLVAMCTTPLFGPEPASLTVGTQFVVGGTRVGPYDGKVFAFGQMAYCLHSLTTNIVASANGKD